MGNVAVVGAQWGDEGKGKIVDWLSERADVVVRFQGGANAGHTLVVGNIEYKMSLLPSGVVRPGKLSIIGNGVVVDPWALVAEIEEMRKKGLEITSKTLRLADNAALILPSHGAIERAREARRGEKKIAHSDGAAALEDRVDDLALAFVAPLDADDCDIAHLTPSSANRHRIVVLQDVTAPEPLRLHPPIADGCECRHRDPARGAQRLGSHAFGAERQQHAAGSRRFR